MHPDEQFRIRDQAAAQEIARKNIEAQAELLFQAKLALEWIKEARHLVKLPSERTVAGLTQAINNVERPK